MHNKLTKIKEDMPVLDRNGNKIGTVSAIQFGDEDLDKPGIETATVSPATLPHDQGLVEDFARALSVEEEIPEELRQRLLRYGYIKIDTGLASSHYARADQVSSVTDEVRLDTTLDELVSS